MTNTPSLPRPSKHARAAASPKLTKAPWAGYAPSDHPRAQALACCPDARCRRAKQCIAAHQDLFCQRTHFSQAEKTRLSLKDRQALNKRFPPMPQGDEFFPLRKIRIEAILAEQAEKLAAETARWKAGALDHLYGKYKACGVLVKPPVKEYREAGRRPKGPLSQIARG